MPQKPAKQKRIKESKLDTVFSRWIRDRDENRCQRCGRTSPYVQIQCSHFYTRNARSVRWDPLNADAMCSGCHRFLETRKNAEYRDWKLGQLGPRVFNKLRRRYYVKKQWTDKEKAELLKRFSTSTNKPINYFQ